MKILQLNFVPRSSDLALLVLRVWFGASMALLHGWGKLTSFSALAEKFADPLGLGKTPSLVLLVFAELGCAVLIALGLWTRLAALILGFAMAVAFGSAHGGKLIGAGNGELAFLYLGASAVIFLAGGGKFSLDAKLGAKA